MPKRRANTPARPDSKLTAPKPRSKGSIRIDYKVTGAGWAYARVRSGATTLETMVSYCGGDGFDGLLKSTLELIEGHPTMDFSDESGDEREVPAQTWFYWYDEPGVWKWQLTYVDRQRLNVQLRTSSSSDAPPDSAPPEIEVNIDTGDWCEGLLALSEKLIRRHGLEGYRASWSKSDFPLGLYLRLLSYRERGFKLGIKRLGPMGPGRSRLADELAILKRLVKPRR